MRSTFVSSVFGARPSAVTSVPVLALLAIGNPKPAPAPAPAAPAPVPADTLRTAQIGATAVVLTAADSLRLESTLTRAQLRRPIERYLLRYSRDTAMVRRVARAVIRQAHEEKVAASLVAAVLVTENTTLKPWAESHVGAVGLMQVMPMHAGQLGCASADLVDVESNICHGTRILARNLRRTTTSTAALLRYNGCVRGTNTPNCFQYPVRVLARASELRQEILLSAAPATPAPVAVAVAVR
jgi:soluble lytic murein transglycosylase-like protein